MRHKENRACWVNRSMLRQVRRARKQFAKFLMPEQAGTGAKVRRNVAFSALRAALVWPIPFLLIPFILEKIGTRGYGTWAVFLTVMGFTSLSDFGLGGTLTKYVAEHYATADMLALKRVLDTGLMLYLLLACLVACILGFSSGWLVPLLFHGNASLSLAKLVALWYWLISIVVLSMINVPFFSVVTGLQRMDLSNAVTCFNSVVFAMLAALFLLLNLGLKGLIYAAFLNTLLTTLLTIGITRRLLPSIRINPLKADRSEIRELFAFSVQVYITQTAGVIQNQIEKLYLAWFAGVAAVGWYNIAAEVAQRARRLPELLLSPVMAAASELHARQDHARLAELYYRSHKYLATVGIPIVFFLALFSRSFVDLWLGPGLGLIAVPLVILVVISFLNLTTGPGYLILIGQGDLRPAILANVVNITLILSLSFVLIKFYGFSGAVIGVLIAVTLASAVFFYEFYRRGGESIYKTARVAYLKPVLCSATVLGLLLLMRPARPRSWVALISEAVIFGAFYLLGLIALKFFDEFDLKQLEIVGPLARVARRIIPV